MFPWMQHSLLMDMFAWSGVQRRSFLRLHLIFLLELSIFLSVAGRNGVYDMHHIWMGDLGRAVDGSNIHHSALLNLRREREDTHTHGPLHFFFLTLGGEGVLLVASYQVVF
jgi:hypothetical protein